MRDLNPCGVKPVLTVGSPKIDRGGASVASESERMSKDEVSVANGSKN